MPPQIPARLPQDPIDVLVDHVCDQLALPLESEPSSLGRSVFARKLREAILDPILNDEERSVVDGISAKSQPGDIDKLLTLRVKRALEHACQATGLTRSDMASRFAQSVIVARGDGVRDVEGGPNEAVSMFTMTQSISEELISMDGGPHVLTNRGGRIEFEQTLDVGVEGASSASGSGSSSSTGSTGPTGEAPQSVAFFEMTEALEALEEHVLDAAPAEAKGKLDDLARGGDLIGKTLNGKYRITGRLGKGGFGTVYQAIDLGFAEELGEASGARVAIKVLNSNIQGSKKAIRSFLQEANRLTLLEHPNIVRWITFDKTAEGIHYFVMEFLEGRELADILKEEKQLNPMRVGKILLDVLSALQCAHEVPDGRALLHLDLKPQNVFMLGAAERGAEIAKVIDFGIGQNVSNEFADVGQTVVDEDAHDEDMLEKTIFPVDRTRGAEDSESVSRSRGRKRSAGDKSASHVDPSRSNSRSGSRSDGASRDGVVRRAKGGTVLYSSPEQCKHLRKDHDIENLDARSDIYSLGVVGFKSLTGTYPFAKKAVSLKEAYRQHLMEPPRKVREVRPKVPRRLAAVIDKCLEKDKERRFQTAQEAHEALEQAMQPLVSKSFLIGAPIMLLPLIALLTYTFFKSPEFGQVNTTLIERAARDAGSGAKPQREPLSEFFQRGHALHLGTDNGGWETALAFEEGAAPKGRPVLMRGNPSRPESIRQLDEVVLERDEQGRYRFNVESVEPLPGIDVFIRWPDAVVETPPFRLTTAAPLRTASAQFHLISQSGEESELGSSADRAIWSGTTQSIQATVFVAPNRVKQLGIRSGGADVEFVPVARGSEDVYVALLPSTIVDADGLEVSAPRTLEVVIEDLAGRTSLVDGGLEVRLTDQPTEIDLGSLQLSRKGTSNWNSMPAYRLLGDSTDEPQVVLVADGVDRIELTGQLTEASRGRKVRLKLRLGEGSKELDVDDGGAFDFEFNLSELMGMNADGSVAPLVSKALQATLSIEDPGLLPRGEGRGASWTRFLRFKTLEQDLELNLVGDKMNKQPLSHRSTAFASEANLKVEIGRAPGLVFGLYRVSPSASTQLLGAVSGTAASQDRRISFDAKGGGTFLLRRFEASLVLDPGGGGADATDLNSGPLVDRLKPIDSGAAIAETTFTVQSVATVAVKSSGFSPSGPLNLRDASVTAKNLRPIEVELTDPESLYEMTVVLRRNGATEMSRKTYSAEELQGDRVRGVWVLAPEYWAANALERTKWPDGEYTVTLSLTDHAGNPRTLEDMATFSVAANLPQIALAELESPRMTKLSVDAVIADGNGIAWPPQAWLEVGGDEVQMRLVDPEQWNGGVPVRKATCSFEVDLQWAWSRQTATVRVSAAKASDASRQTEVVKTLRLTRVRPRYQGETLEPDDSLRGSPMKLIRGPSSNDGYVFAEGGGLPARELWAKLHATGVSYLSEVEREKYSRFLPSVNFFPTDKPIVIQSEDLRDYYLDESEVSQAEFLEFVKADGGYRNPEHWPFLGKAWEGSTAVRMKERRKEWTRTLGDEPLGDGFPVTGVLCEEALAFASWAGKRLPTLLEWEYAVRGEGGRVFAVGPFGSSDGPRAFLTKNGELDTVRDGRYLSPEGIYHLGGNVAEWTQTPYWDSLPKHRFEGSKAEFCSRLVNGGITMKVLLERFRDDQLDVYGTNGPLFFIAGAGWAPESRELRRHQLATPPHDYRVVARLPLGGVWLSGSTAPRVGFRCAKSTL